MTEAEYTKLYTEEWGKLTSLCKRLLGRDYAKDAEDCAQEVFLTLWRKKDRVLNPGEYIYSAAHKQAAKLKELGQRYDVWGMPINLESITRAVHE